MTRDHADCLVALGLIGLAGFLMWESTGLPIGWEAGKGPGGGAFPFWLALAMLAASTVVFVRSWVRLGSLDGASEPPLIAPGARRLLVVVVGLLVGLVALTQLVGIYVAVVLFLGVYLKGVGRHSWWLSAPLCLLTPVAVFLFFEIALRIPLPKGVTEPWFQPLFALFL